MLTCLDCVIAFTSTCMISTSFLLLFNVFVQLRTLPLGLENIVLPSAEAQQRAYNLANQVQQTPAGAGDAGSRKWHRGELEFEAMMRRLENAVCQNLSRFYV
jgi:hypothetical protein